MRKKIIIEGINLAYLEFNETGTRTIFFIHGNSGAARGWENQLNSSLFREYRLVAFDLPGHGQSESPVDEELYSPPGTARLLAKAITAIAGQQNYYCVGLSYGSNLIAEMVLLGVKPAGIAFISPCVTGPGFGLEIIFPPSEVPSIFFYNEPARESVQAYLEHSMKKSAKKDIDNAVEDYLAVSPVFKPALFKAAGEGKISDEIRALKDLGIPVLVVFGQEDKLVNTDYLNSLPFPVWRGTIYKINDAGHSLQADNPGAFNQLLSEYLAAIG